MVQLTVPQGWCVTTLARLHMHIAWLLWLLELPVAPASMAQTLSVSQSQHCYKHHCCGDLAVVSTMQCHNASSAAS